jgi:hypothetical protein
MLGQFWWILPLFVFICGCILSWYFENTDGQRSGYFRGVAFVIAMIITTMMTVGIIVGHFI